MGGAQRNPPAAACIAVGYAPAALHPPYVLLEMLGDPLPPLPKDFILL